MARRGIYYGWLAKLDKTGVISAVEQESRKPAFVVLYDLCAGVKRIRSSSVVFHTLEIVASHEEAKHTHALCLSNAVASCDGLFFDEGVPVRCYEIDL